ncbi:MAG TPA: winged helix-turn-helix domain-containing protein [Blastocatellia bacterium]|nr:winged helix-turn-helix domain-containing protein [Blastocatellia bacterium]
MALSKVPKLLFEFGPFVLDATERVLLHEDKEIPLSPKVFDTLLILVENEGHVLEKDELMHLLWPDSFVEESSLTQKIFLLRKILGEKDPTHRYIDTLPKRGYRFTAEVKRTITTNPSDTIQPRAEDSFENVEPLEIEGGTHRHSRTEDSFESSNAKQPTIIIPTIPARKLKTVTIAIAAIFAVFGGLAIYEFCIPSGPNATLPERFSILQISKLTTSGEAILPVISPDGKYIAHVVEEAGQQSIRLKQVVSTSDITIVTAANVRYKGLSFSPDGNFLNYVVYGESDGVGQLFRVPTLGGTPKKVTTDIDSIVTYSPDGGHIAFIRINAKESERYLIIANADGTGEQILASRKAPSFFTTDGPSWSPDGNIIAITGGSSNADALNIKVLGIRVVDGSELQLSPQRWLRIGQVSWIKTGSGLILVARDPASQIPADQIWYLSYPRGETHRITNDLNNYAGVSVSADSKSLVTVQSTKVSRLWIARNGDSDHAKQIANGFMDNCSDRLGMSWLPDGRIVLSSRASGNPDIWIMNADGNDRKQLTIDTHYDIMPAASPDGHYIVFVSDRSGSLNLWRMNSDGTNQTQITHGKGEDYPSFSPDGKWIVYSAFGIGKRTLWKVPVEGGDPVQLTTDVAFLPVVSPDGKKLACYLMNKSGTDIKMALLSFDDGNFIRFFDTPLISPPDMAWTPDSNALCYATDHGGTSNIWRQPIDGRAPQQLTNFKSDQIFRFSWSMDGKTLACERGTMVNDVVIISHFS